MTQNNNHSRADCISVNSCTLRFITITLVLLAMMASVSKAQAPADVLVKYTLKLASFEKNISNLSDVSIYVLGDPDLADVFISKRGETIGKAKLAAVMKSDEIPGFKVSILFIASDAKADEAIAFAKEHKVLTITSIPELVSKGVALGIGADSSGKIQVTLNMTASKEEGLDWNPAIMKIAKTVQ